MLRSLVLSGALLSLTLNLLAAQPPSVEREIRFVQQRMAALRPGPDERRWQNIPWETDLEKAFQSAVREKRPVLMWGADDEPLERC